MVRGTSTIFPVFTWIKEGCVACYEVTVCLNLMVLNAISLDISIFKLFRFRLYKKVLKKINYFYKGCAPPVPVPKTPKIYDFWGSMVMGLCSLPPVQARSSPSCEAAPKTPKIGDFWGSGDFWAASQEGVGLLLTGGKGGPPTSWVGPQAKR